LIVQIDEPALPAVLSAAVPTASGFGRHRKVDTPEASDLLALVLSAVSDAGAEPWVHSCAPGVPWDVVRRAGARTLSVDLDVVSAADLDKLAEGLDAGDGLALGVVPSRPGVVLPGDRAVCDRVLRLIDMLGFDPEEVASRLVLTPACGLAGSTPQNARAAIALVGTSAAALG
jgi:hypothetical protein